MGVGRTMRLIGLTGGIASGKTLVSNSFADLGAPIVDADLIAREVVAPNSEGLATLQALFGDAIIDATGALNRVALRRIIFSEPEARAKVDALLHPKIRALSETRIQEHAEHHHAYLIYAIPLLVETGQVDRFDDIVVVDVAVELQLQRLMARDNSSRTDAQRILDSQASREARLAVATHIIDNSKSIERCIDQVRALHTIFINSSQKH